MLHDIERHNCLGAPFQQSGFIPDDTIHFLDYAAEMSLLGKVGRGYNFMHALLLDYFSRRSEQERTGTADLTI